MTQIHEALAPGIPFREARVQGNVVQGVAVLTPTSLNGRRYTKKAREDAAARVQEGVRSFADHGKGERSVRDLIGTLRRGRVDGSGTVRGDLHLLDTPLRPLILSAAEGSPEAVGLSIDGRGSVKADSDGRQVVEAIELLRSVDVVANPASTSSLFETLRESAGGQPVDVDGARARIFGAGTGRKPPRRRREPTGRDVYQAAERLW